MPGPQQAAAWPLLAPSKGTLATPPLVNSNPCRRDIAVALGRGRLALQLAWKYDRYRSSEADGAGSRMRRNTSKRKNRNRGEQPPRCHRRSKTPVRPPVPRNHRADRGRLGKGMRPIRHTKHEAQVLKRPVLDESAVHLPLRSDDKGYITRVEMHPSDRQCGSNDQ